MAAVTREALKRGDIIIEQSANGAGFLLARLTAVSPDHSYARLGAHRTQETAEMVACEVCESGCSVWLAAAGLYVRVRCEER